MRYCFISSVVQISPWCCSSSMLSKPFLNLTNLMYLCRLQHLLQTIFLFCCFKLIFKHIFWSNWSLKTMKDGTLTVYIFFNLRIYYIIMICMSELHRILQKVKYQNSGYKHFYKLVSMFTLLSHDFCCSLLKIVFISIFVVLEMCNDCKNVRQTKNIHLCIDLV